MATAPRIETARSELCLMSFLLSIARRMRKLYVSLSRLTVRLESLTYFGCGFAALR